jgi:hypothetical protein
VANWPRFFEEVRRMCDASPDGSVELTIVEILNGAESVDGAVYGRGWWNAMMNPNNQANTGV